jgi:uncharacterized membrane protein YfhO
VFSEVYYPNGWKAYIDGKEAPIVRVDYVLRGLNIPAGNHTIHFVFAPAIYDTANIVNLISGIISIIALLICALLLFRKRNRTNGLNRSSIN